MGFIIVVALLALSAWSLMVTVRRLRQTKAGRAWWIAFGLLLALGVGVGTWFAFSFEYQVSPGMRYASFPVPLAFFHLEDGHWVDFITPPYIMYPGLVANIAAFTALALLPLLITRRILGRSQSP
jgi:hypothetical protein